MALKRGFTLIEIIVYMVLSLAVMAIIVSLFRVAQRTGEHTYAQFLVGGNLATTVRQLRQEIQSTTLASIEVHGEKGGTVAMTCISAYDDRGQFQVGVYGTPYWQKHVGYVLDEKGRLHRTVENLATPSYLPVLAPASLLNAGGGRVLMHDTMPPQTEVKDFHKASNFGGFEVGFVRRTKGVDSISYQNPRQSSDPASNTRLLEVTLRTLEDGPSSLEVRFRVMPRY